MTFGSLTLLRGPAPYASAEFVVQSVFGERTPKIQNGIIFAWHADSCRAELWRSGRCCETRMSCESIVRVQISEWPAFEFISFRQPWHLGTENWLPLASTQGPNVCLVPPCGRIGNAWFDAPLVYAHQGTIQGFVGAGGNAFLQILPDKVVSREISRPSLGPLASALPCLDRLFASEPIDGTHMEVQLKLSVWTLADALALYFLARRAYAAKGRLRIIVRSPQRLTPPQRRFLQHLNIFEKVASDSEATNFSRWQQLIPQESAVTLAQWVQNRWPIFPAKMFSQLLAASQSQKAPLPSTN